MHSEYPHRGITMHRLPVGDNLPGLVFSVGSALIFLFAIPALWYVLVAAVAVGLVIAALLQIVHREHLDETARLTLLR
jgi:hypothetical protein